jgi:hypothetical protein
MRHDHKVTEYDSYIGYSNVFNVVDMFYRLFEGKIRIQAVHIALNYLVLMTFVVVM